MEKQSFFNRFKKYFIIAGIILAGSVSAVIAIIFLRKNPNQAITDLKDAISTRRNKEGTMVLPKSKNLDKTLADIENDIINN